MLLSCFTSDFLKATSLRTLSSGTKSYFYCFNYQIYKILVLNFYLIFFSQEIIIFRWFSNEMKKMKNCFFTLTIFSYSNVSLVTEIMYQKRLTGTIMFDLKHNVFILFYLAFGFICFLPK
jgi:hypothetical protein